MAASVMCTTDTQDIIVAQVMEAAGCSKDDALQALINECPREYLVKAQDLYNIRRQVEAAKNRRSGSDVEDVRALVQEHNTKVGAMSARSSAYLATCQAVPYSNALLISGVLACGYRTLVCALCSPCRC